MSNKTLTTILKYASETEASELFLEEGDNHLLLEYVTPGNESRFLKFPKKADKNLNANLRHLFEIPDDELVKKKYYKFSDKAFSLNFLLTISSTKTGERVIIKIVPKSNHYLSLNQLGLERDQLKTLRSFLNKKSGLILLSSPDNQGKSTSLISIAKEFDKPSISTYWLGPAPVIEFNNISILASNSRNWEKILNLDSEVIITEINSFSELNQVAEAVNRGRLIIATLNANSVWQALALYLESAPLLENKIKDLNLILNQRLVPLKRQIKEKRNKRQQLALFEFLEITPTIKKYLKSDINSQLFWSDLLNLAKQNNYLPLQENYKQKKKINLI